MAGAVRFISGFHVSVRHPNINDVVSRRTLILHQLAVEQLGSLLMRTADNPE